MKPASRNAVKTVSLQLTAALLLLPQTLAPAVITVEPGCNLVAAISAANEDDSYGTCTPGSGADTIRLTETVVLTAVHNTTDGANGLPSITSEITIDGRGFGIAREFSSAPNFRIFHVAESGDLTLDDVIVSFGVAAKGGGIFNLGKLTLLNSTVGLNLATSIARAYGGGIYTGYYEFAETRIENSRIHANQALGGIGAWGGGISGPNLGSVVLVNSTVDGNVAEGDFYAGGGGIHSFVLIYNSTISGNTASTDSTVGDSSTGGGIDAIGGFVEHATFSGNTADIGAAAFSETSFTTLGLSGSLFANSTGDHCGGWVADSGGGNLADDGTCLPTIDGSLTGLDPVLSDNGGPTPTHELLAGSSAIDAAGDCSNANDQRGAGRVGDCDSGAFEWIGCNMLELEDLEITLPAIVPGRTCNTAVLGPDLVVRSTGFLWIEAGHQILLKNGFVIQNGGEAQLSIDPSLLLMP